MLGIQNQWRIIFLIISYTDKHSNEFMNYQDFLKIKWKKKTKHERMDEVEPASRITGIWASSTEVWQTMIREAYYISRLFLC